MVEVVANSAAVEKPTAEEETADEEEGVNPRILAVPIKTLSLNWNPLNAETLYTVTIRTYPKGTKTKSLDKNRGLPIFTVWKMSS
jgi:hypothetical protein